MEDAQKKSFLRSDYLLGISQISNNFSITQDANDSSVSQFLIETEEFNDIVIFNKNGEVIFFNSQHKTLDDEYLRKYKNDFKFIFNCLYDPENTIEDYTNKYKNLNEYFYRVGIKILNRTFNVTRFNLPFIFTRDLINNEELCFIKTKDKFDSYLTFITYFPEYSAPLIIDYYKGFLPLYNQNFKIDDDFNRF